MSDIAGMGTEAGSYTPEFTYLKGEYDIGEARLPYFNLSLRVDDALKFVSLPRDVVFDPTEPIALEELFQRELDEERVREKLVPYLKAANKSKFFNSITVALLPMDPDHPGQFLAEFPGPVTKDDDDAFARLQLGPMRVRQLRSNDAIGYLSWDSHAARAVVLDGQHRLFGLKEVAEDPQFRWRAGLQASRIPVIVLALHKELGYKPAGGQEDETLLAACRTVFIDLNKHSVRVSPERQYLLDDLDLYAVCMRSIMGSEAGAYTRSSISERIAVSNRVPLALVDWYSGKAKFDKASNSLHLTSTLVLYDHVVAALDLPTFAGSDYSKAKRFVDGLVSRLDLAVRDQELKQDIQKHLSNCQEDEVPFALLERQVHAAGTHFRDTIGRVLVRFLTEAKPYQELLNRLEGANILGRPLEAWMALDEVGKAAFPVEEEEERPGVHVRPVVQSVKRRYPLAYQVVFQRAMIDVMVEVDDNREELAEEWGVEASRQSVLSTALDRFNTRIVPQLEVERLGGRGVRYGTLFGRLDRSRSQAEQAD